MDQSDGRMKRRNPINEKNSKPTTANISSSPQVNNQTWRLMFFFFLLELEESILYLARIWTTPVDVTEQSRTKKKIDIEVDIFFFF